MPDVLKGSVSAEIVETTEQAWIPGAKKVEVVLQPVAGEEPFFPPVAPYAPTPTIPIIPERSVVLNIETTGIMPFTSQVIHIAAIDLSEPGRIITFFDEDEEQLIGKFFDWFEALGFTEIIGYNVAFDYRFLFTKAMRYRIQVPRFNQTDLFDVMNAMKQVKAAFVFGFNRPGKLDEWTEYLFGETPPGTVEDVLEAWEKKDFAFIETYNSKKVELTLLLWVLFKFSQGEISG